jgi:putative transcriptional regulator
MTPFEFADLPELKGLVLVAKPELLDPNFHQTIVYLVEHSADGALGFVMNRPAHRVLREVVVGGEIPDLIADAPVFLGGPVKPTGLLFARFRRGATDEELDCEIVAEPGHLQPEGLRVFAGYAGWGEGQLERELRENAWKVCRPHVALLDEPLPPALWPAFIGADQRWRKLHSRLPKNPGNN